MIRMEIRTPFMRLGPQPVDLPLVNGGTIADCVDGGLERTRVVFIMANFIATTISAMKRKQI